MSTFAGFRLLHTRLRGHSRAAVAILACALGSPWPVCGADPLNLRADRRSFRGTLEALHLALVREPVEGSDLFPADSGDFGALQAAIRKDAALRAAFWQFGATLEPTGEAGGRVQIMQVLSGESGYCEFQGEMAEGFWFIVAYRRIHRAAFVSRDDRNSVHVAVPDGRSSCDQKDPLGYLAFASSLSEGRVATEPVGVVVTKRAQGDPESKKASEEFLASLRDLRWRPLTVVGSDGERKERRRLDVQVAGERRQRLEVEVVCEDSMWKLDNVRKAEDGDLWMNATNSPFAEAAVPLANEVVSAVREFNVERFRAALVEVGGGDPQDVTKANAAKRLLVLIKECGEGGDIAVGGVPLVSEHPEGRVVRVGLRRSTGTKVCDLEFIEVSGKARLLGTANERRAMSSGAMWPGSASVLPVRPQ